MVIQQARLIRSWVRSNAFGVGGVPLIQPLESLAPALPAIRVRPEVSGGGFWDGWDGGAGGCYGKTRGVEWGERVRSVVGVGGVDSGCGRWGTFGDCGEVSGEMLSSLGRLGPGILWRTGAS